MSKITKLLKGIDEGLNTANQIRDTVYEGINIKNHIVSAKEYRQSEQYKKDMALADKYGRKYVRWGISSFILWIVMIIATIVLCVTGNDVVLRFLHL